MTRTWLRSLALAITSMTLLVSSSAVIRAHESAPLFTATDAIRMALSQRLGDGVEISVTGVDVKGDLAAFREAKPDPAAQLGKPVRFTLILADGSALPVTANVVVVVPHAIVRQAITRGQALAADDVTAVTGPLTGTPIMRVPTADDIIGTRALRPMTPGTVIQRTFVSLRRTVEAGDAITVVAMAGAIEVTAQFIAADGGNVGEVIRVRNPDSKKFVRGRVVKAGLVEVIHDR
jgi:flagella basal body P-ring formation protein FlgA